MRLLDDELRVALRRREPPEGFAERVLERIAARAPEKPGWREFVRSLWYGPRLRWVMATAVVCLLLAAGGIHYRQVQRERLQGEIAKQQLMKALRIASTKLNVARDKVQKVDRRNSRLRSEFSLENEG